MIIGVVGSRKFFDYRFMRSELDQIDIEMIVSGGARGADALAYRYAIETGIMFICHPPLKEDIENFGFPDACRRRNRRIAQQCDRLVAFPLSGSKGTWHTIKLARELGKSITLLERKT
jgi:predicted Rossmann fold nucleotide-binding protein DprA/Smf involved in DNA uptake